MIKVENLTKFYDKFCALDKIDFEINKGEIVGLLGPNGAGKTTTLRILTCYLAPTDGNVKVKDFNILDNPIEIKNLIGYLPESAPLYQDRLVYDYLSYIANIRNISREKKMKRLKEIAHICQIEDIMHKDIHELSRGLKQRVGLAHAMIADPEILVLDEPTSGLDPNQIVEIRELIKKIGKKKTVIISSHILSEIEATCDRIVIINKGKIVADGSTEEIKQSTGQEYIIHISIKDGNYSEISKRIQKVDGVTDIIKLASNNNIINFDVICDYKKDVRSDIFTIIKNYPVLDFHQETKTLENIFRELTRED
ncbi:MAG: ATP-binding cassette domain-containing protein [Spirochaetales bacterium]|nr:ATP-binding cassette domain-containing protein [Spirochaetales bacterium]